MAGFEKAHLIIVRWPFSTMPRSLSSSRTAAPGDRPCGPRIASAQQQQQQQQQPHHLHPRLARAEVLGRSGAISPSVLPLASTVLARAVGLAGNPQFLGDLAATIEAWAAGLAITVAVAVPSGLVLGSVPGVRTAAHAVVEFLRPIPAVALIPLVALILGPGLRMNVTLIVYAAIWPVLF